MFNDESDYLTSYNFARISDVVFAELLTSKQFFNLNLKNVKVLNSNNLTTSYQIKNLVLKDGDVIFTNSGILDLLFYYLRKLKKIENLILITSQTDIGIDKRMFSKKPKCIKTWYSVNVDYEHKSLIPIPLGLANNYSPKNLLPKEFLNNNEVNKKKVNKLYINLQKNTNLSERKNIYDLFSNFDWVELREPNLSLFEYLNDLKNHRFVLCPMGNGIDTHRLWETLYSGSIPVTKNHINYSGFKDLPIIFVNSYEEITLDLLLNKFDNLSYSGLQKLNIQYWKSQINSNKQSLPQKKEIIYEKKIINKLFSLKRKFLSFILSKRKILVFYIRKFISLFS